MTDSSSTPFDVIGFRSWPSGFGGAEVWSVDVAGRALRLLRRDGEGIPGFLGGAESDRSYHLKNLRTK